ncbi:MAG: hypothetical protein ABII22_05175 [Candidatus Micrarchaeota archaeon]
MRPKLIYLGLVFLLLFGLVSASEVSISKVTFPSKIAPSSDKTLEIKFTVTTDIGGGDEAEGNLVVENLNDKNPDGTYVKTEVPFSFTGPGSKIVSTKIIPWGKYDGKTINFRAKVVYSINKATQAKENSFGEQIGVFVTSNPSGSETITLPTPQAAPECTSNSNCASDKKCSAGKCVAVTGTCGYALNHAWVAYECCVDVDCGSEKECRENTCYNIPVVQTPVDNSPPEQVNNVPNNNLANTSPPANGSMETKGIKETVMDNIYLVGAGTCCCTTILIIAAVLIYMFVINKKK